MRGNAPLKPKQGLNGPPALMPSVALSRERCKSPRLPKPGANMGHPARQSDRCLKRRRNPEVLLLTSTLSITGQTESPSTGENRCMPDTGERREITSRTNAKEAETIRQSNKLLAKAKQSFATADAKNHAPDASAQKPSAVQPRRRKLATS